MLRMTDPVPVDPVDVEDAMPLPTEAMTVNRQLLVWARRSTLG
jgi:hypothetical protein